MHLQPVFAHLGYSEGDLPVAEEAARTALALPMHPNLSRDDVAEVVAALGNWQRTKVVRMPSENRAIRMDAAHADARGHRR